jgi:ankyrin repeat protein
MCKRILRPTLTLSLIGILSLVAMHLAAADSPVADAAMREDRETVRAMLQKGVDVNASQGDGMTAPHWAAEHGDIETTEMLLYAGANPKAVTRIGQYTALHIAAREGHALVAEKLLKAGALVNAKTTNSGVTPLHLAAASGDSKLVKLLLDSGAEVNALETESGQTPLIFAAAQNRVDAIRVLLERRADPSITSKVTDIVTEAKLVAAAKDRQTKVLNSFGTKEREPQNPNAIQAAVLAARELYLARELPKGESAGKGGNGNADSARDSGSDQAAGTGGGNNSNNANNDDGRLPPITTKGGLTALLHAARQGYIEAAMALLDGGADINQVSAGDATSPLLMAIINAQFDLALRLLERGANPNLAAAVNGVTPLWAAVNAQWQPRTRFPQPQEHDFQQATYLDVMKALLDAGANPNVRLIKHPWYLVYTGCGNQNCGLEDTEGSTAFWRAAYATDVEAMRLLVSKGADPTVPTKAPPPRPPRSGTPLDKIDSGGPPPVQPGGPALWPATNAASIGPDPSGLPPVPEGGPGVFPIHAASGVGYGEGFAANAHRHAPDAWLAAVKYLVELGADVNARDNLGYTPLHHAASRGDNELILYLVSVGADVKAVARSGQTVADMANGPVQRVSPFPETVALLEKLGSKNNHKCVTC